MALFMGIYKSTLTDPRPHPQKTEDSVAKGTSQNPKFYDASKHYF